ncbi:MAG: hypothetical protein SF069_15490 [Phycisphaerae bacterium]|nr:hypothetical protein [Phycisphaerae bacterium]
MIASTMGMGCASTRSSRTAQEVGFLPSATVVVAPVLNLSASQDFDPARMTDLLASELAQFEGISVVPVNLSTAALAREGKRTVDSPEEALRLSAAFGADATVVAAITEFHPYDPPTVGLIIQWYGATDVLAPELRGAAPAAAGEPRVQAQRVFNADDQAVVREIKEFCKRRDGNDSPHGWRKYVQAQELYVRYSIWSLVRSILRVQFGTEAGQPNEADQ